MTTTKTDSFHNLTINCYNRLPDNLQVVLFLVLQLLKKSIPMLTIAYVLFLVMNVADAIIGFSQKDNGLIIGAIVMCIITSTMVYFINKKNTIK